MKKLFLSFAVIASLGLVSCGNKAAEETAAPADEVEAVEEEVVAEPAEEAAPAEDAAEAPAEEAAPAAEEAAA